MENLESLQVLWDKLITGGVDLGKRLLAALFIYIIGKIIITIVNHMLAKSAKRKTMDPEVRSFMTSAIRIGLNVMMIIAIIVKSIANEIP